MTADYQEHLRQRLVKSQVPPHLHRGLIQYISERHETGSFLRAVLENDLSAAVGRTDTDGHADLPRLVFFLVNYAPDTCWGSRGHVDAWLADPEPAPEVYE